MAYIIRYHSVTMEDSSKRLKHVSNELSSVLQSLPKAACLAVPSWFDQRLTQSLHAGQAVVKRTVTLSGSIRTAASVLENCEHQLKRNGATHQIKSTDENKKFDWYWSDLFSKGLGTFGPAGSLFSSLYKYQDVAQNGNWIKLMASGGKAIAKWSKIDATKAIERNKELFGLTPYLKTPSTAVKWTDAFSENFSSKMSSSLGNPITWITAGVVSAVDNVNQVKNGEISMDRAAVETVVETTARVVISTAATAAVGAAIAATVGVSAPVVVVGIGAAFVTWAADTAWKNTLGNGKGMYECLGTYVGDQYDKAKPQVIAGINATRENLSALAKQVGSIVQNGNDVMCSWARPFAFTF